MADRLEKTEIAQAHHDRVTSEIPITVCDDPSYDMFITEAHRRELNIIKGEE